MSKTRVLLVSLGLLAQTGLAAQMRSRAEGVPGVLASNTVGLGDIWVTGGLSSYFRISPVANDVLSKQVDTAYRNDFRQRYGSGNRLHRELVMVPDVGGVIGLANFLHLEVSGIPWDGEKLGATTARLQLTLPGNDNLRVFGLGLALNATLSTEEDVYSRGETTPGFDPLLSFTVMADLDWIKVSPSLPLKLYVNYASLDDYRLPRRMLTLEITEGIVIQNLEDTISKMRELKRYGVSFAMDDFGTGYSSLTYLKRLPVDALKIDQTFVRDAPEDPNDAEIVRAIVAMARSLDLTVIAEGVELTEQLEFLERLGCHLYQGYLHSRPLPLPEFRQMLLEAPADY